MCCLALGAALLFPLAARGQEWTTDLSKMKFPATPVAGKLQGMDFKPDAVSFTPGVATFKLKVGKELIGEQEITLFLFLKQDEALAGKTYALAAEAKFGESRPHIHISGSKAKLVSYVNGYALKLEFGDKKDGKVAGKIYLCLPDESKSVVAGTFTVAMK
jgi:hypothetical protein